MKTTTLTLENEPIDFGDTAFLSIVTQVSDFMLADNLNRLYGLRLRRIDDLAPFMYPCYLSNNKCHSPLEFRLLQLGGGTNAGDMPHPQGLFDYLLIVSGSWRAKSQVQMINSEFNAPDITPNPYDLPEIERQQILRRYRQGFTVVNEISFTAEELEQASFPGRRTLKGRSALADHYARILDAIDLAS